MQIEVQIQRSTDWEQEKNRNRVALGTLLQIDPKTQEVWKIILKQRIPTDLAY